MEYSKFLQTRIAIVGATGLVGTTLLQLLQEIRFPPDQIRLFASSRSAGTTLPYQNLELPVYDESELDSSFQFIFGFCSNGVTKSLHDRWAATGAFVIDNSSAYRLTEKIPLIVPEVNPSAIQPNDRWIANPNCSTIQLVRALKPMLSLGLQEISVATYQSVSGAGRGGLIEYENQRAGSEEFACFRDKIVGNVVPWIAQLDSESYSGEEMKMRHETRKIFDLPNLPVQVTCVRVPVTVSHGEAVHVKLSQPIDRKDLISLMRKEPGLVVRDELAGDRLPTPLETTGSDDVFVGRIRTDPEDRHQIALWVVADNVRVGAATNALRIAKLLAK